MREVDVWEIVKMPTTPEVLTGSASVVIDKPIDEVFAALTDITRMGEWSPECAACRWAEGADGPAMGAKFEGDNLAKVGPVTLKKWTTTSEVTGYVPNEVFEFESAGYTRWRYDFEDRDGSTAVTESFSYQQYDGWQKLVYGTIMRRDKGMIKGMQTTLEHVKAVLEG